MDNSIDLNKYEIRTDLAIEKLDGCINKKRINEENYEDIKVSKINLNSEDALKIGKKEGFYITILFEDITNFENREKVGKILEKEIRKMLNYKGISDNDEILIIGLGNEKSTPDALGPLSVNNILVTRHLFTLGEDVKNGIRSVAAITPGVMGETGIETMELIKNVVDVVRPKCVIIIDALASSSIDRVNKTIQMTDTGIHPGSGVGNTRKEINEEILGIPVLAIGVPTVVDAVTIVNDSINYLFKHISYIKENEKMNKLVGKRFSNYKKKLEKYNLDGTEKERLAGLLGSLDEEEKKLLLKEVLENINYNLIVTPKEEDYIIEKLSDLISSAINNALHESITHY